jgi:starvation-inducible DNA-binding protein
MARGLAKVFADTHALQAKSWRFQRDIAGPLSIVLRPVLQRQGKELGLATDRIAERMRSLGLAAHCPRLGPSIPGVHQGPVWTGMEMIDCLVGMHELVVHRTGKVLWLAEEAMDLATCDLLRQRIEAHEKAAWVLVGVGFADLLGEQFDPRTILARTEHRAEPALAAPPQSSL